MIDLSGLNYAVALPEWPTMQPALGGIDL